MTSNSMYTTTSVNLPRGSNSVRLGNLQSQSIGLNEKSRDNSISLVGVGNNNNNNNTELSTNEIISDLIEKTKVLAEELKNSNRISADLMEENTGLRNQYTSLKQKFLAFLAEQSEQQQSQQARAHSTERNTDESIHQLERENAQLRADHNALSSELAYANSRVASLEKRNHSTSALLHDIDSNKDREIANLNDQIALLKEQIHAITAPSQTSKAQIQLPATAPSPGIGTITGSSLGSTSNLQQTNLNHPDKFYRTHSSSALDDNSNTTTNQNSNHNNNNKLKRNTAALLPHQSLIPSASAIGIGRELRNSPTRQQFNPSANTETLRIPVDFKLEYSTNGNSNNRQPIPLSHSPNPIPQAHSYDPIQALSSSHLQSPIHQLQQPHQPLQSHQQQQHPQQQHQPQISQSAFALNHRNFEPDLLYSEDIGGGFEDPYGGRNTPKVTNTDIFPDSSERMYRNQTKSRTSSVTSPITDTLMQQQQFAQHLPYQLQQQQQQQYLQNQNEYEVQSQKHHEPENHFFAKSNNKYNNSTNYGNHPSQNDSNRLTLNQQRSTSAIPQLNNSSSKLTFGNINIEKTPNQKLSAKGKLSPTIDTAQIKSRASGSLHQKTSQKTLTPLSSNTPTRWK